MPTGNANFYITDANGIVTAQFDGRIVARGLSLTASSAAFPTPPAQLQEIVWNKSTDGSLVAEIFAYDGGALVAKAPTGVYAQSGSQVMAIVDNLGQSDFLRQQTPSASRIQWGTDVVSFTASTLGLQNVNHSLGQTPQVVIIQCNGAFAASNYETIGADSYSAVKFRAVIFASTAITVNQSINWIAIG